MGHQRVRRYEPVWAQAHLSLVLASAAMADMTGVSIGLRGASGNGPDPASWNSWSPEQALTVGPGVEYSYQSIVTVDLAASTIRVGVTSISPVFWVGYTDFNGFIFRDVNDALPDFTGISLGQFVGTSWGWVVASVYDRDTLMINFGPTNVQGQQALLFYNGNFGEFNVTFAPAPGALTLLVVAVVAQRRGRAAARSTCVGP